MRPVLNLVRLAWLSAISMALTQASPQSLAARFDDVSVMPQPIISGQTHRGYLEHRMMLANHSGTITHRVTVILPNPKTGSPVSSWLRLSRSVSLGPGTTMAMKLWQPAIPLSITRCGVYIDNSYAGEIEWPQVQNHSRYPQAYSGQESCSTILVSRSLNGDDLQAQLTALLGEPSSPARATGPPSAENQLGDAWRPAMTNAGASHWIELEYNNPLVAHELRIFEVGGRSSVEQVELYDADNHPLTLIGVTGMAHPRRTPSYIVPFSPTPKPVAKVRLTVRSTASARYPGVGIDAVELVGNDTNAWAARAQASSYARGLATSMPAAFSARYGITSPSTPIHNIVRSELEPALWSDHWLAYTPFDLVLVTARDMESMPAPAQTALWSSIECGGALAILGAREPPEPWRTTKDKCGAGANRYRVGFGQCLVVDRAELKSLNMDETKLLIDTARSSAQPWSGPGRWDMATAQSVFPVVESVRIPFRALAIILMGFVVLIGPVNLWVLARLKKHLWILWSIPVISICASAVIFGFSLLGEGVTPHLRVEGITVLDQINQRASTLGLASYYCPLTPRGGLQFGYDTELTPPLGNNHGNQHADLDWSQAQHLSRGWLSARVPACFRLRKSEPRRERLQLERNDRGQRFVINGLGTSIDSLRLADFSGQEYSASNVAAGARCLLKPLARAASATPKPEAVPALNDSSLWGPSNAAWQTLATNSLSPGTYHALLSNSPFIEDGLSTRVYAQRAQVVVGLLSPREGAP